MAIDRPNLVSKATINISGKIHGGIVGFCEIFRRYSCSSNLQRCGFRSRDLGIWFCGTPPLVLEPARVNGRIDQAGPLAAEMLVSSWPLLPTIHCLFRGCFRIRRMHLIWERRASSIAYNTPTGCWSRNGSLLLNHDSICMGHHGALFWHCRFSCAAFFRAYSFQLYRARSRNWNQWRLLKCNSAS